MNSSLTAIDRVKLMIIAVDDFTDDEIWQNFLDFEISDEDEINELSDCLDKHRPVLSAKMAKILKHKFQQGH
ncbi:MAG: hypothetical protein A3A02_03140 [Candidatus Buchananbacteria bacterium RIFCSPLOWO2_01_FULL_39_33]|uniref:Uncharacterized protein n=1 Tax=Candidatus Buchananbacteria bacterium RIFCSPLOWO2_01_FULL_39_33 TaxID=1797543 RepID=A0A1G1YL60_9BACT|nr:MAG: hypothetical protein A3A02_03140 [Candidatus Buchananbacteria bacterium RIFCSPLOWO2_01_FULL_39_33]